MPKAKRQELGKMFATVPPDPVTPAKEPRPDRVGKRATLFQLPAAAKKQLAIMAIENETTQQELLVAALNMLFERYGKPPIA
jgi:antitoxin-like ribbon-helix-helix protein